MKKRYIAILIALVCMGANPFSSFAGEKTETAVVESSKSDSESYDFKKFKWGDTQEYVESIEGEPSDEADMKNIKAHYITYDSSVAGKDAILVYYFCDEGLFYTKYILTEKHSNENLYIDDFNDVIDALKKKYGKPDTEWENWQDSSKKDYYANKKGDALSYGYLNYYTWWEDIDNRTDIFVSMTADNYIISTVLEFQSIDISVDEADYSDDF